MSIPLNFGMFAHFLSTQHSPCEPLQEKIHLQKSSFSKHFINLLNALWLGPMITKLTYNRVNILTMCQTPNMQLLHAFWWIKWVNMDTTYVLEHNKTRNLGTSKYMFYKELLIDCGIVFELAVSSISYFINQLLMSHVSGQKFLKWKKTQKLNIPMSKTRIQNKLMQL